jgi:hypothetical protein
MLRDPYIMATPENNGLDPRRWMKSLPAAPEKSAKPAKQTMMARISGFFRVSKAPRAPQAPLDETPMPEVRPLVPGEIAQRSFLVPRCRSACVAGESIENPPMEIAMAMQQVGDRFGLVFFWKDADSPDETRQRTAFSEEESYVRQIFEMVVREVHAPRKLAEEIARARVRGKAEEEGVLKALVEMETRQDWQFVYGKPG